MPAARSDDRFGGFLPVRLRAGMPRDRTFGSSVFLATPMLIFDGRPVRGVSSQRKGGNPLAWLRSPNQTRLEPPPDRRKLIAVLYADMVAYSRLIGLDDAGTFNACVISVAT